MKKKKEIVGIIPKEKIFAAEKPRYEVSFKTGRYMTEKDRPRKKYRKSDMDRFY